MARPPRLELAGVPLHVVQRGVNRGPCFFNDVDRRFYLKCLTKFAARRGCAIHAYALMSNHVHLLVTPHEKGAVGAMLQDLGRTYVRVLNTVHGRTGTLWEGRYKSSLVDTESYFLTCHRYIELNPVRAGIVSDPAEYPWSSHSHYALGVTHELITEHPTYGSLGGCQGERQRNFRSLFRVDLDAETLNEIRAATNAGAALGSESFINEIGLNVGRKVAIPRRGRPRKPDEAAAQGIPRKLL